MIMDNKIDLKDKANNLIRKYNKYDFPGMREDGGILSTTQYTLAEYEYREFRLKPVAEFLKPFIDEHFILYDKKGTIYSDKKQVIDFLNIKYEGSIEVENDILTISDVLIDVPVILEKTSPNITLWHMQLHPNNQNWNKEIELLKEYSIIGLGQDSPNIAFKNFSLMNLGDIVLIKNGNKPIALVEINGDLITLKQNFDSNIRLDWFKHRRNVKVLEYAPPNMAPFPQPRGTLSIAQNIDTNTYDYIFSWYNRVINSYKNSIIDPKTIKVAYAKPSFGIETIAEILSDTIIHIPENNGMMVGIFGKWGRGKTYLCEWIFNKLKDKKNSKYHYVRFSSWKYQESKELWAYLYEVFLNHYTESKQKKYFKKLLSLFAIIKLNFRRFTIKPILIFLLSLVFSIIIRFFFPIFSILQYLLASLSVSTLIKMVLIILKNKNPAISLLKKYISKTSYTEYLGLQAEIENDFEHLICTWIPKVNDNEKIVLFVDDIDRCDLENTIKIIDGLRIILENNEIHKRLIIITAIDENILKQGIKCKYSYIEDEEKLMLFYKEYLEKVFIVGIKLNPLDDNEIIEFMDKLIPKNSTLFDSVNQSLDLVKDNIASSINEINITIEDSLNNTQLLNGNSEGLEISTNERENILKCASRIKNATPRKLRIFYYKYLLVKKILNFRLLSANQGSLNNNILSETLILDFLIHVTNNDSIDNFDFKDLSHEIINELTYTINMFSVV